MRILFLGTPSPAVHPLRRLVEAGHEVVTVVTQPDRPAGRSGAPQPPPVKQAALELGLPVFQPETLRDDAVVERLRALQPEAGVVAAYGEILRRAVLEIPTLGYLNIHPSLLPLYRGPSPVAAAILAGDEMAGVTVMLLERAMDAGPILAQTPILLDSSARAGPLTDRLFALGAEMLVGVLPLYASGDLVPAPQEPTRATVTRMLTREDGRMEWTRPAIDIERAVRAYDPWPGSWTTWKGQPLKILSATVEEHTGGERPGAILDLPGLVVAAGVDAVRLREIQPAGKRTMSGDEWKRGQRGLTGARLGT